MVEGISIHAPTWGATEVPHQAGEDEEISIHAPTWGATVSVPHIGLEEIFQSTHPRGVRRRSRTSSGWAMISIHAPTWGATQAPLQQGLSHRISIHAPTLEVRPQGRGQGWCLSHRISIHAPTWGATMMTPMKIGARVFQSTHPRGVRHA